MLISVSIACWSCGEIHHDAAALAPCRKCGADLHAAPYKPQRADDEDVIQLPDKSSVNKTGEKE